MQPVATMFTGTLKEDEIVAVGLANTVCIHLHFSTGFDLYSSTVAIK